ncbi:MAG TPA: heparinase II/III family protein, partial [Thermoanaerobaculia bacterium]
MRGQVTESVLPARLRRLAGMEAAEIGYRLRERARCEVERAAVRLRGLTGSDEGEDRFLRRLPAVEGEAAGSVTGYLRRVAARRFYLPADRQGREALAELVRRSFPGTLRPLSAEAERLSAHRFELLGFGEVDLGPEIDWHRDPLTGEAWERRFWADYDLVHEEGAGDPKRVHELARHQHLPRLGKAYFLLGEERYALEVVRQMLGWIDQNPPGVGVHWHSSLEIALRAVSWLWALFFVLPSRAMDEAAARRIVASLFAQLDHVHAYPSVFSSPNTHLLGEAAALFLAGLVFPDCEGGAAWRDRGAELLAAEAERQVLPDGVHAELSTGYHAYALDFYLQVLALGRGHRRGERGGRALELPGRGPEGVDRRVEGMAEVLLHVLYPDGGLPRLGDDDGGRALALKETSYGAPL